MRKPLLVCAAVMVAAIVSLAIGSERVGLGTVIDVLFGRPLGEDAEFLRMVVHRIRIPRTLAAIAVGASFGLAGATLQTVTRNRLAETDLLGINGGAALGVVVGITVLGIASVPAYMLWAFGGALLGTLLVVGVAGRGGMAIQPLRLVLAGLALAAMFQGLIGFLLLQHQHSLDQYRFWVLGSLGGIEGDAVLAMLPVVGLAVGILAVACRGLGAMRMGDDVARSLGHHPAVVRVAAIAAVTLLTGAAIALTGPVILLGLVAPYLARHLAGPSMGRFLAAAAASGAAVLLVADCAARVVVRPYESPVSVLVVLVGAPLLIHIARSPKQLSTLGS